MNIKTSLFNSSTNDTAVVIDLLRASTTITVALSNFKKVIPVNNDEDAFRIKKENDDVILAGEKNLDPIKGYDITNSPKMAEKYHGNIFVINTTNGTKVLENIKKRDSNVNVLIGASINAEAVASKALNITTDEIELVMAGRRGKFNIEDCIGAGLIIHEIKKEAQKQGIPLEFEESAIASMILTEDKLRTKQLIANSQAAHRLKNLGLECDVDICSQISSIDIAGVYTDGIITRR